MINVYMYVLIYVVCLCLLQVYYFDRDDVVFLGFSKFFKNLLDEEWEYVEKLMKYQNKRGGCVVF